jgi:hypothetical protein
VLHDHLPFYAQVVLVSTMQHFEYQHVKLFEIRYEAMDHGQRMYAVYPYLCAWGLA